MFHVEQEGEWDAEQVALLLAAEEVRRDDEVGPHGIRMSEATSPLADPSRRFEGWHYEARVRIDHAQRELNQKRKARADAYPDEDAGSLIWSLTRVEDGPPPP